MRSTLRFFAAALLCVLAADVHAFRPRPVSDLRFDDHATGTWSRAIATDGEDGLLVIGHRIPSREGVFTQKVVNGQPAGPRRQISIGSGAVGLAWTGSHYLAGFLDPNRELVTARISRDGSLLSEPVNVLPVSTTLHLAINQTSALAIGYTENKVTVRPVDLDGNPTGPPQEHTAPLSRADVTIAAGADRFAVVLSGFAGTAILIFRPDGSLLAPPQILDGPYDNTTTGYHSRSAWAAANGSEFCVIYGAGVYDGDGELVTIIVGTDGTIRSKQIIDSDPGAGANHYMPVGIVWNGSEFVALVNVIKDVQHNYYEPALVRITAGGARSSELVTVVSGELDARASGFGATNRQFLVLTVTGLTAIDAGTWRPVAASTIGLTLTQQSEVTIEAGPGGYLAAWFETDDATFTVRASRIDAAGNYLDGRGIVLATIPREPERHSRDLAIDGSGPHWLVAWAHGGVVRTRTVSFGGVPGALSHFIHEGEDLDVIWRGSHYVLLRSDGSLHADTLRSDGALSESRVVLAEQKIDYDWVGFGRGQLVVIGGRLFALHTREWTACGLFPLCGSQVDLQAISLDDTSAAPIVLDRNIWYPVGAASDGQRALVLWTSYEWFGGAFLTADGQVSEPFALDPFYASGAVAHDGSGFVAVWRNEENRNSPAITGRISPNGVVTGRTVMRVDAGESPVPLSLAASATLPPLAGFELTHPAYDSVRRGGLLFTSEFAEVAAPPPAPQIVCATENADGTITVRWQQAANTLGIAIELQLADGTFREIGVAAAGATTARVSRWGLGGNAVRVRAWNERGLSQPSALAPSAPSPAASLRSALRACAGKPVTIAYTLSGVAPFTVRWSDGLVQTNLTANASRTVTVARDTTLSIVSVSHAGCGSDETTRSVRILVDPAAVIEGQPRDVQIARGQTATLTIDADDDLDVAWFEGDRGDMTRPVGTNSRTFTTPALQVSTRYWVRVSNRCGSSDSAPIVVSVSGGKGRAVRH